MDKLKLILEDILNDFVADKSLIAFKKLMKLNDYMFPEDGNYPIEPDELGPVISDFFMDEAMWEYIAEAAKKKELNSRDESAADILSDAIADLIVQINPE